MVPTMSSGVAMRCIGTCSAIISIQPSTELRPAHPCSGRARVPGVRVRPGAMTLAVTPFAANSVAIARVKPMTPDLLAM